MITLLVIGIIFASGCANKDDGQPSIQPTVQSVDKTSGTEQQDGGQETQSMSADMPQSVYIGSLETIPKFGAGKDLNTKATITNIGNTTNPEYMVEAFIGNKGDKTFEAPMVFGWFIAMSEEAEATAAKQGLATEILTISSKNMLGATIEPGYGTDFVFTSGENTTALVKANDGYLRFNLIVITDPYDDNSKAADLLVFTINDLPTIIDNSAGQAQLGPGESIEIPLYKAGVDI